MIPFSMLDLAPIPEGSDAGQALRNSLDLARHCERLGYNRYWLAEHHGMPGIASAATAVVIGQVAAATSTIRVGAGGIMLPNHAPLIVAEQFGTLAALFPGRVDLGLGRAPGTDPVTSRALRRTLDSDPEQFPQDVVELMNYFKPDSGARRVRAVPGEGLDVPFWILGSSLFGAQLAARLGLPYAFASHFAPMQMMEAIALYRALFRPSEQLDKPYVMLGFNVCAADSDEEALRLFSSNQQAFINLRSGRPGKLPAPVDGYFDSLDEPQRALLAHTLSCSAVGSPETVRALLQDFIARTEADELMLVAQIHDHAARVHSCELAADAMRRLGAPT